MQIQRETVSTTLTAFALGCFMMLFHAPNLDAQDVIGPEEIRKFVWVGKRGGENFTPEEIREMEGFDVIVIARFHGDKDRRLHHEAAGLIRAQFPDTKVLAYLAGEQKFDDAGYLPCSTSGVVNCDDFDEVAWGVECTPPPPGTPLPPGGGVICAPLTRPTDPVFRLINTFENGDRKSVLVRTDDAGTPGDGEIDGYQEWILEVVRQLVEPADPTTFPPFDGVMFDVAYGAGRLAPRTRDALDCQVNPQQDPTCPTASAPPDLANPAGCEDLGPPCVADLLVEGLSSLLQRVKNADFMADKTVMYNGLQFFNSYERGCCRHVEPLLTDPEMAAVDGVHNEYFCWHRDLVDYQSREQLLRDLSTQWAIGRGELGLDPVPQWVVSKVNYLDTQETPLGDVDIQDVASYCYAAYQLASVDGRTTFKLGHGSELSRGVLSDEAFEEREVTLGHPLYSLEPGRDDTRFQELDGDQEDLVVRQFEHGWVVVNMNSDVGTSQDFIAPESLNRAEYEGSEGSTGVPSEFEAGEKVAVRGQDATFLEKAPVSLNSAVCADGESHNRYTAGIAGLEWARRLRTASDAACCDTRTACVHEDRCVPSGSISAPLDSLDAVCVDKELGGESGEHYGPALYACDENLPAPPTITDVVSGRTWCCGQTLPEGEVASVFRFEPGGHFSCSGPTSCSDPRENAARRMGEDFGRVWGPGLRHGTFSKCCDPQLKCNRDACFDPGTLLPRLRDTDEICGGIEEVTGASLPFKPAIYTCNADQVGMPFTDGITGASWCCTERTVDGRSVYVFDDPSHESCQAPPAVGCRSTTTNRKSFWGPNLGTDWSRRDPQPTLSYNAEECCNPSLKCNRGGQCYAPGELLPRLGATQEVCAKVAENSSGQIRPAIYSCAAETLGQTMTTPDSTGGSVSYCCSREVDLDTGVTKRFFFQTGACQG